MEQANQVNQTTVTEVAKTELTPEQIYTKRVINMSNCQLARELRKQIQKTSKSAKKTDVSWASVLSIVFESTETSGLGGRLPSALRG